MMTRRSSSNLCKLTNSKDSEGAISTPYPEKGHTKTKNYALNIGKSLEKKLTGCASEHLKYEMKPGKNLVISLSSAAYELAKSYIVEKTQLTEFSNSFAFVKESGVDLNNAVVDFRLKFFNRKKDGEIGCIQKFVVNFYNTTSRVMVNGSRVDIFCEEILEPLEQHIFSKCESLDAMNCGISSIIQAIKFKQNQKRAVQETVPQISSNTMTESDNTSQAAAGDLDNSKLSELNSSVERIFFCPICDQAAELETIACEQCDGWYHYSCAGITEKDINKIGKDIPYICECCSDNLLYGTQLEDTSKLTELGSNEKNENNTNISSSSVIREEVLNDLHISQTFKDSFTYTQDAFNCSNEMNGTFNVGHPASPISLQDRCEPDRLFQITESANPCTDKGNTKSDIQVTHPKECGKEKNSDKGTKQAFKSNLQQVNVNEAMNSQHSEQQCDKLQTISGAVGGEKRKSRLKDSKKNSDKHDLDQKIYILDLERKVKEQDKTINLLAKRIDMMSSDKGQDSSEFSPKMDDPVRCGNTQPQSTTQTELVTMEMRMRQLEFSMLQSMAMFTTCTAQLNMQLQNQNTLINNVQNNQFTQGSINPYQPYLQPTGGHPPTILHMGNQPTFGGLYQPHMVSLNGPQLNNVGFHQHPMGPQQSFTGVSQPSMMRPTVVNPSMNGYTHPPVVPPTGIHLVPQPQAIPVFCPQPGFGGPGGLPVGTTMETQQQQQQQHVVPPPFFSIPPPAMNRAPPMPAYNQSAPPSE